MKKVKYFTKSAIGILMLIGLIMFAAGCSDDKGSGNSTSKLPAIPEVTGGSIKEHSGNNAVVTSSNLDEFYLEFGRALHGSNYTRSVNKLRGLEYEEESDIYTVYDGYGGSWVNDYWLREEWDDDKEYELGFSTSKQQFFNFSRSQRLFLGGALGFATYFDDIKGYNIIEVGANGTIEFRGSFKGSIEFKNAYLKYGYDEAQQTDLGIIKSSGKIIIKSGSNELNVNLSDYLDKEIGLLWSVF